MDRVTAAFLRFRDQGDTAALGDVFDALAPRLLALALHWTGHPSDAEDLLQQVFLQLIRDAAQFDPQRPLEPWLAGRLVNAVRNHRRRERIRRTHPIPEAAAADGVDPGADAERSERIAMLRTHIDGLAPEQREVLLLVLHHGLAPAEVAEVLAVPPGTVRMRLHRGIAALRRLLPVGIGSWLPAAQVPAGLPSMRERVLRAGLELRPIVLRASPWPFVAASFLVASTLLGFCLLLAWPGGPVAALPAHGVSPSIAARGEPPLHGHTATTPGAVAAASSVADGGRAARTTAVGTRLRVAVIGFASERSIVRQPLAGVHVQLQRDGTADPIAAGEPAAVTGDDGIADVTNVDPGTWNVAACIDGHEVGVVAEVSGSATSLEISVPLTRRLAGRVIDAEGRPVSGAELWATNLATTEPAARNARRVGCCADDGAFELWLPEVQGSEYGVLLGACHVEHGASWSRHVAGEAQRSTLVLQLAREHGAVEGRVIDRLGAPMSVAMVVVEPDEWRGRRLADGSLASGPAKRVVTCDQHGRFVLGGLRPGRYRCRHGSGSSAAASDVEVTAGATAATTLAPPTGGVVLGRLRRPNGEPIVAEVRALSARGSAAVGHTDADGVFDGLRLPCGAFTLEAWVIGRRVAARALHMPDAGNVDFDWIVDEPTVAHGWLLTADLQPMVGWRLLALAADDGAFVAMADVAADGSFVCHGRGTGRLHIHAGPRHADEVHGMRVRHTFVDLTAGVGDLRLVVPAERCGTGSLRASLVGPLGTDMVTVRASLRLDDGRTVPLLVAADGCIRGDDLASGPCMLQIEGQGFATSQVAGNIQAGGVLDLGILRLSAGGTLRVRPLLPGGLPWSGDAPAPRLSGPSGEVLVGSRLEPIGDELQWRNLQPGRWLLRVDPRDAVRAEPVVVELRPGTTTVIDWYLEPVLVVELRLPVPPELWERAGDEKIELEVNGGNGEVDSECSLMFDAGYYGGFGGVRAFRLGSYELTARSSRGRVWRGKLDVRSLHEDATSLVLSPSR